MIKAIALDDEPPALKVLENYCSKSSEISLAKTFIDPSLVLKYLHKFPVDLLFLDIQMPGINGLEFSKKIPATLC
jgi:two-component SAPR family response regulator